MSKAAPTTRTASFLKSHPRLMGALFMTLLLLSQGAGAVAGAAGHAGP